MMAIAVTVLLFSHSLNAQRLWAFAGRGRRTARGTLLHVRPQLRIGFTNGRHRPMIQVAAP
jgi:hypothetical protein